MTKNEKVIIGSTAVIGISALTMLAISKKYDAATQEILADLNNINYTLSKSREDIIAGNKSIDDGNRMLRSLLIKSAEENVDKN